MSYNIKKYLKYLRDFQHHFVLVPADKAANNIIVVCYLVVVLNELTAYVHDNKEREQLCLEHIRYMANNRIEVKPEYEDLPSFYWLPYGKGLLRHQIGVLLSNCLNCLLCAWLG